MTNAEIIIERIAAALYSKSWMATQTGPNAPTWDDIKADPGAEQWRVIAREYLAGLKGTQNLRRS